MPCKQGCEANTSRQTKLGITHSFLGLGYHLIDVLLLTHSLIACGRGQLTSTRIQTNTNLILEPLYCFQDFTRFLILGVVSMDPIECANRAVTGWKNKRVFALGLFGLRKGREAWTLAGTTASYITHRSKSSITIFL